MRGTRRVIFLRPPGLFGASGVGDAIVSLATDAAVWSVVILIAIAVSGLGRRRSDK